MRKSFLLVALTLLFGVVCAGQDYSSYLKAAKKALTEGRYEQAKKNAEVYNQVTGTRQADSIIKEAQTHLQSEVLVNKASELYLNGKYDDALTNFIDAYELCPNDNIYAAIEKSAEATIDSNSITVNKSRGELLYQLYRKSSAPIENSLSILKLASLCQNGDAAIIVGNYYKGKKAYSDAVIFYEIAKKYELDVCSDLAYSYYCLSVSEKTNKTKYEKLSFENYKTAAENNNRVSQYNLGLYYQQGRGTNKDLAAARTWFERSYKNGYEKAKEQLDELNKIETGFQATTPITGGITVKGHVRDKNEPLIGATIMLDGTTKGTLTDLDGNYVFHDVPANGTLVFEYKGYINQRMKIEGKSTINVTLRKEPCFLKKVFDEDPIIGASLISDFNKFPIGIKGDLFWGLVHVGLDISAGSNMFHFGDTVIDFSGGYTVNGETVEPIAELVSKGEETTRGVFAYTITPGIFYKYVSLDCGLGQIWTITSRIDTYRYSYSSASSSGGGDLGSYASVSTEERKKVATKNSYFVFKPGVSALIGDTDEIAVLISARYRICPREKSLNGFELSLGVTIPF